MSLSDLSELAATMSSASHSRSGSSSPVSSPLTPSAHASDGGRSTPDSARGGDRDFELESTGSSGGGQVAPGADDEREEVESALPHHHSKAGIEKLGLQSGTPTRSRRVIDPSERRTVFLLNLPRDTTVREVRNLFAFADGFLRVQLYDQRKEGARGNVLPPAEGDSPASGLTYLGAFALFDSHAHAVSARERLHGFVFDPIGSPPVVLEARLAQKNLFVPRDELPLDGLPMVHKKASRRGSVASAAGTGAHTPVLTAAAGGVADYAQAATQLMGTTPPGFSPLLQSYANSGYHSPALGAMYGLPPPSLTQSLASFFQAGGANDTLPASPHPAHVGVNVAGVGLPNSPHALAGGAATGVLGAMQNLAAFQQAAAAAAVAGNVGVNGASYRSPLYTGAHHSPAHAYHAHAPAHPQAHAHSAHHQHGVGPFNPPCTTLFLARLEATTDEELYAMLVNSFPTTLKDTKFVVDSKGQRIAFVEFDSIESASTALGRIHGHLGIAAAFSKNPLNVRSERR